MKTSSWSNRRGGGIQGATVAAIVIASLILGPSGSGTAAEDTTWDRIQKAGVILVGYNEQAPWSFIKDGKLVGIDPDILSLIMQKYGVRVEGVHLQYAGLFEGLRAQRFDAITASVTMTAERCKNTTMAFAEPHGTVVYDLAVRKGNPLNFHSFADVVKNPTAKVGTNRGALTEGFWRNIYGLPEDRLTLFSEVADVFAALDIRRIDAYATTSLAAQPYVKRYANIELAQPWTYPVDKNGKSLARFTATVFRPNDTGLLKAYNQGIAELKQSGKLREILNGYGMTLSDDAYNQLLSATTAQVCNPS